MIATFDNPVLKIDGPPGGGKTMRLAREAVRLIQTDGLPAESLLILAASAANRERLRAFLEEEGHRAGMPYPPVPVMTLDEFFAKTLRLYAERVQVSDSGGKPAGPLSHQFRVIGDLEALVLLRQVVQDEIPPGHPWYYAARSLSFARGLYQLFQGVPADGWPDERIKPLYDAFVAKTRLKSLITRPDLADLAVTLAGAHPASLAHIRAVLVDEAQELSENHYRFFEALDTGTRLVLAGNSGLSIRTYRGARPEIFEQLHERLGPVSHMADCNACLRETEPVLALLGRWRPGLYEHHPASEPLNRQAIAQQLRFGYLGDPAEEAEVIAGYILEKVQRENRRWSDIAILLRTGTDRPVLMNALAKASIPADVAGMPENLNRLRHFLFDGLQLLRILEEIGFEANSDDERFFAPNNLSSIKHLESLVVFNRHLQRFLSTMPDFGGREQLLAWIEAHTGSPRLFEMLLSGSEKSGFHRVLADIRALYRKWCESHDLTWLVWEMTRMGEGLADVRDDAAALRSLGRFFQVTAELQKSAEAISGNTAHLLADIVEAFDDLWHCEADAGPGQADDRVRILGMRQAQGESFECVVVPFLSADVMPMPPVTSVFLSGAADIETAQEAAHDEEQRLLVTAISRANASVFLTTHKGRDGKPVLPSPFFKQLLDLSDAPSKNTPHICWCDAPGLYAEADPQTAWVSGCTHQRQAAREGNGSQYEGASVWAGLLPAEGEGIFDPVETIQLSASSISNYMKCPRQFYYRKILALPETESEAAAVGNIVHKLLEVFNRDFGKQPYTKERLLSLCDLLFGFEREPAAFLAVFPKRTLDMLQAQNPLKLADLKHRVSEAIEDLDRKDYFTTLAQSADIRPEVDLGVFQLAGLPRVAFRGHIDALVKDPQGCWHVLDYKHYGSHAYATGLSSAEKNFARIVEPLPEPEEADSHEARFRERLSRGYPKDYQLLIYYLALQQQAEFAGKVRSASLQIVRPQFPDRAEQGAIRLSLDGADIDAATDHIVSDLRQHIAEPILSSHAFEAVPERQRCRYCSFAAICDATEKDEGGEW